MELATAALAGCCSRRQALAGLAALPIAGGFAGRSARSDPPRWIDLHCHFIPPAWLNDKAVRAALPRPMLAMSEGWSPDKALAAMDRAGIHTAIGSVAPPGVWYGDASHARDLARAFNVYAASLREARPERFGFFAAMPLPDIDGALAEIAFAFDHLGADGIGLFTNYGRHLADPSFAPVFDELNRRKATVYVHPTPAACCGAPTEGLSPAFIEFPVDTTRVILQWIMVRASLRWPDVKLIFSHAGGYIMGGLGRLQFLGDSDPSYALPHDMRAEVARFYYEVSSSADPVTMRALRSYVPPTQIVLGTDAPYVAERGAIRNIAQLDASGLPSSELLAIKRGNALTLLPGLRARGG